MTGEHRVIIKGLLHRLSVADASAAAAWTEFIDRYAGLIMKTVSQFEYRHDRANECFLDICEKLCERQFRRLQQFNTAGKTKFTNWLSTVVFNLCIDWHRAEFGRATVLPAIKAMPAFDQLVYRNCFELEMDKAACFQAMKSDFPELEPGQIGNSLQRIHELLTPRQRWQFGVRKHRLSRPGPESAHAGVETFADPAPGPEDLAQSGEDFASLQSALLRLNVNQRLVLHLRFQEGLTYGRIAVLEHLGDAHRARRHVQAALDALYLQMQRPETGKKRQI